MGDLSPHFDSSEFACKCGCGYGLGENDVSEDLIRILENMRDMIGGPIVINSGCRCVEHNNEVGGVPNSAHTRGLAADISVSSGWQRYQVVDAAFACGAMGVGVDKTFVHVDVDTVLPRPSAWSY